MLKSKSISLKVTSIKHLMLDNKTMIITTTSRMKGILNNSIHIINRFQNKLMKTKHKAIKLTTSNRNNLMSNNSSNFNNNNNTNNNSSHNKNMSNNLENNNNSNNNYSNNNIR
jgi:hypothetical protein